MYGNWQLTFYKRAGQNVVGVVNAYGETVFELWPSQLTEAWRLVTWRNAAAEYARLALAA